MFQIFIILRRWKKAVLLTGFICGSNDMSRSNITPSFVRVELGAKLIPSKVGMRIDKILTIPIPYRFLLIDSIPYRFSYRFLF